MQQGVTPEMKRITETDFGKWPNGEKFGISISISRHRRDARGNERKL
jgi:hypothetical protein